MKSKNVRWQVSILKKQHSNQGLSANEYTTTTTTTTTIPPHLFSDSKKTIRK